MSPISRCSRGSRYDRRSTRATACLDRQRVVGVRLVARAKVRKVDNREHRPRAVKADGRTVLVCLASIELDEVADVLLGAWRLFRQPARLMSASSSSLRITITSGVSKRSLAGSSSARGNRFVMARRRGQPDLCGQPLVPTFTRWMNSSPLAVNPPPTMVPLPSVVVTEAASRGWRDRAHPPSGAPPPSPHLAPHASSRSCRSGNRPRTSERSVSFHSAAISALSPARFSRPPGSPARCALPPALGHRTRNDGEQGDHLGVRSIDLRHHHPVIPDCGSPPPPAAVIPGTKAVAI